MSAAIPEPGPDAPPWAWSVYFNDRLATIREDLRNEGTTLERVLADMRKRCRDERKERWRSRGRST